MRTALEIRNSKKKCELTKERTQRDRSSKSNRHCSLHVDEIAGEILSRYLHAWGHSVSYLWLTSKGADQSRNTNCNYKCSCRS